jgi:phosphinothricin acetyltransferase
VTVARDALRHNGEMIRDAAPADAAAVAAIYNHYIEHTVITFEVDALGDDDMRARIAKVQSAGYPWLVWDEAGEVRGYAYARQFRDRAAYEHSAEATVYLALGATRRGIGSALYGELVSRLRAGGTHLVVGGIALPNEASVALHESLGFTRVGTFNEIGRKFDRWIDVGFWQLGL